MIQTSKTNKSSNRWNYGSIFKNGPEVPQADIFFLLLKKQRLCIHVHISFHIHMVELFQRYPYENLLFRYSLRKLQNNQESSMISYNMFIYSGTFHKLLNESTYFQNLLKASKQNKNTLKAIKQLNISVHYCTSMFDYLTTKCIGP